MTAWYAAKNETMMTHGSAFANTLLDNCIPMIEKKYRVKRDKWHRAIAGFSMGSMQASVIGLTNMEQFAYIGLFSGFMLPFGSVATAWTRWKIIHISGSCRTASVSCGRLSFIIAHGVPMIFISSLLKRYGHVRGTWI